MHHTACENEKGNVRRGQRDSVFFFSSQFVERRLSIGRCSALCLHFVISCISINAFRSAMAIRCPRWMGVESFDCHMRHMELPPILSSIVRVVRIVFVFAKANCSPFQCLALVRTLPAKHNGSWESTAFSFFIAYWIATMMGLQSMWTLVHHQTIDSKFDSDAECDNLHTFGPRSASAVHRSEILMLLRRP